MMSHSRLPLFVAAVVLFAACVDTASLDGRSCPCAAGWTCCEDGDVCVGPGQSCPTVDTAPPPPPVFIATPGSPTAALRGTLEGVAEARARVIAFASPDCSGAAVASTDADVLGAFQLDVALPLDATTRFSARAEDAARNASACSAPSAEVIQDATPPQRPVLSTAWPDSPSSTTRELTVHGTTEPGARLTLFSDPQCASPLEHGVVTAGEGGDFTATVTVAPNTTTTVHGTAMDRVGNVSLCSTTSIRFTHDTLPPSAPTLALAGPTLSNDPTPSLTGTAEADATVELFAGACADTPVSTVTAALGTFAVELSAAPNAMTQFFARARDAAGNASGCGQAATYVHDDRPPALDTATTFPASPGNWSSPTIAGRAEPLSKIQVCLGPCEGTGTRVETTTNAEGNFVATLTVRRNQSNTLEVWAIDAAGNLSAAALTLTYDHDDIPPAAPQLLSFSQPNPTAETTLEIFGVAETGARLQFFRGATAITEPILPFSLGPAAGSSGDFYFFHDVTVPFQTTVSARAFDAAGNGSLYSKSLAHDDKASAGKQWQWSVRSYTRAVATAGGLHHSVGDAPEGGGRFALMAQTEHTISRVETALTQPAESVVLAASTDATALAVWTTAGQFRFSRYAPRPSAPAWGEWSAGADVVLEGTDPQGLQLTADAQGGYVLAYHSVSSGASQVHLRRYSAATGWAADEVVGPGVLRSLAQSRAGHLALAIARPAQEEGREELAVWSLAPAGTPVVDVVNEVSAGALVKLGIDESGRILVLGGGGTAEAPVWSARQLGGGWTRTAWPVDLSGESSIAEVQFSLHPTEGSAVGLVRTPSGRFFVSRSTVQNGWGVAEELRLPYATGLTSVRVVPFEWARGVVVFAGDLTTQTPIGTLFVAYHSPIADPGKAWSDPEILSRSGYGIKMSVIDIGLVGPYDVDVLVTFGRVWESAEGPIVEGGTWLWTGQF